jgi:site-specific recombinase XerD
MAGVDLMMLARLLGHRNLNQVKRYAHLAPDHLHAAVDRTAASLFAGEVPRTMPHATPAVA